MNNSKKIVKGIALGTAMAIGSTIPANADDFSKKKIVYDNNIENYESQSRLDFYQYLSEVDMANYDINFVNLYRDGKIIIDDQIYEIKDLFIETGYENNEKRILLVSCHNPNYDLLTQTNKADSFEREEILSFRKSLCFYQLYEDNKLNLENNILKIENAKKLEMTKIIYSFDGEIQKETPETAYEFPKNKK